MVFSPYTARKLAETTARKVKEKITSDEVTRQIPNQSKSHRAPRDVPHFKSGADIGNLRDERVRLRAEPQYKKNRFSSPFSATAKEKLMKEQHKADTSFFRHFGKELPFESKKIMQGSRVDKQIEKKKLIGWTLQDHKQQMVSGPKKAPQSMVPDKLDREMKMPSMFEQIQFEKQKPPGKLNEWGHANPLHEGKNKGALKDGMFREPLKPGEQSYDPEMTKKWTGIGLGLGGAGALGGGGFAYDGIKEKKTMGRPDYSNYFG